MKMKAIQLNCEVKALGKEEERVLRFVASSEAKDRERDVIDAQGWKTDNYMKNPVVLFGHDYYSPPVGRAKAVLVDPTTKMMLADVQFPKVEEMSSGQPSEHALFVDTVYNMAKNGYINAMSVGFRALQYSQMEDYGIHYTEQELLELSIVPVPANPEALMQARSAGVVSDKAFTAAQKFFDMERTKCADCAKDAPDNGEDNAENVDQGDESPEAPAPDDAKNNAGAVEKAGRRLSAASMAKINTAIEAVETAVSELKTLLDGETVDEDAAAVDNTKNAKTEIPVVEAKPVPDAGEVKIDGMKLLNTLKGVKRNGS
jgi:HK97 family phage prohead protease